MRREGPERSGLAEASLATVVKLLVQPALALLVLPYFVDVSSVPGKVALLMAALPTAANAFVLAKQFDLQVERVSSAANRLGGLQPGLAGNQRSSIVAKVGDRPSA